jgi:hypothetical protein
MSPKFTLADLDAVSVPMEIKHPKTGESIGVTIELLGPDSATFRNLSRQQAVRRLAKGEKAPVDLVELTDNNDQLLASCIVGWTDEAFFLGPYTKAAALELIKNPARAWLRRQIDDFTEDRKNFFRSDDSQPTEVS